MTTAPNWAIAPAGPSPARTDSGTGCTWSLTSWVAALSAAPSRTRLFRDRLTDQASRYTECGSHAAGRGYRRRTTAKRAHDMRPR